MLVRLWRSLTDPKHFVRGVIAQGFLAKRRDPTAWFSFRSTVGRELAVRHRVLGALPIIHAAEVIPSVVHADPIVRLIPGVLHDGTSLLDDSFQEGLLDAPQYTRPAEFRGMSVPEVLLSGNHELIEGWRHEQRLGRTRARRSDLLK